MKNLKKGDRVILKANHPYENCDRNLCEGSEWFCEGVIVLSTSVGWVRVKWNNHTHNLYETRTNCLELVNEEVLM